MRTKDKYLQRKPMIVLICEGRNQTEKKYFSHFNNRSNPYILKTISSESTDIANMVKKAKHVINEFQLDRKLGDRVFCVIDLDLSENKYQKLIEFRSKKHSLKYNIEFIVSNPCFEIWFLYHFDKYPGVESSSQKVKEKLKKKISQYTESYDIAKEYNLLDKVTIAINNAELNNQYDVSSLIDRNPYTEVPNLIELLLNFHKYSN